ncbi:hypothetical protein [Rhizomonospora bruguierae]|uniref:hypothetical protein n=1 Tax=Rhizomonospora bruguierae TaxID=1581705 RepID=UPI0020BF3B65|nr:hypothetical protein [Micromonospora sp. NBRC 107566]
MTPRRWAGAALAGVALALALAGPAQAHGADAPDATNYRTAVTGITPALPGLTVRTIEAGARLELTNRSGRTIEVLGYSGEPYLELRPDGVYENVHSPATYLNLTLAGDTPLPPAADPTAPPQWRRTGDGPSVRWHDHRANWMNSADPPNVRAAPNRPHRVQEWSVPLRDGVTPMEIKGTLDWLPPPQASLWWAGVLLAAAALAGLGLAPLPPAARAAIPAAMSALGGAAAITYAVGRSIDAGCTGAGIAWGLFATQIWPVVTGLAALAAAGYVLARRPAADFALALAGACLAVFAGLTNAAVFGRSVAPAPWDASLARALVLVVIAAGAGIAVGGALRLRRDRAPHPGERSGGSGPHGNADGHTDAGGSTDAGGHTEERRRPGPSSPPRRNNDPTPAV